MKPLSAAASGVGRVSVSILPEITGLPTSWTSVSTPPEVLVTTKERLASAAAATRSWLNSTTRLLPVTQAETA